VDRWNPINAISSQALHGLLQLPYQNPTVKKSLLIPPPVVAAKPAPWREVNLYVM
jgi:hypothetical protein